MIRPARPGEAVALVDTYDWLFAPPGSKPGSWDPGRARERLAALIGSADGSVFVAESSGEVVGIICPSGDFAPVNAHTGRRVVPAVHR